MTKHPLHPKLIDALSEYKTCPEAMRAAADWQLKQVIEWLKNELPSGYPYLEGYSDSEIDVDGVLNDLKKAMRPQKDN
jgi:hypothetical protein